MPEPKFLLLIKSSTLLSDGAMGTMPHARGVSFEKCFDELNMTKPVRAILQQLSRYHICEFCRSRRQVSHFGRRQGMN
jgi:methionine synthase I (cobalamin-dependent)